MNNNLSNFLWSTICMGQFITSLLVLVISMHLAKMVDRLTGLMLAVQEFCDRILELRGE